MQGIKKLMPLCSGRCVNTGAFSFLYHMKYRFMDLAGAGAFDTTMKGILRPVFPGHSSNIP